MNHKKKARRCRGLALDPCLDSSIPRSSNSLVCMYSSPTLACGGRGRMAPNHTTAQKLWYSIYIQHSLYVASIYLTRFTTCEVNFPTVISRARGQEKAAFLFKILSSTQESYMQGRTSGGRTGGIDRSFEGEIRLI